MPSLTDLNVEWVSLVDRAAVRDPEETDQPMRFLVWKREHEGAQMTPEEQMRADLAKAQEDLKKAEADRDAEKAKAEKAEHDRADLAKRVEALEKAEPTRKADEEPINKDELDPAVRAALEKAEAAQAKSDERAVKAEKDAAEALKKAEANENARLTAEFVTKAESYEALPINKDEFGPVLKAASEHLSKEEYEALERVLKAADEALVASDVFKELGRGREGAPTDALAEVTTKAAELRKSDPRLTEAAAQQQVFKADPDLAARYQDERRAA